MEALSKNVQLDATGKSIGRIATMVAVMLQGKHKANYQAHIDGSDTIEIRNAAKVLITGKKLEQKKYYHYSGYPGGMIVTDLSKVMEKNPADAIRRAVTSMLPRNRLRKDRLKRLSIFND